MKTEQEQINKMARTMCGYCSTDGKCAVSKNGREPDICANVDDQHCLYKEYADRLIENGFGDISEYKAEIEQLKKGTSDIRKGTAKEILQTLYDKCYEINDETGESMGNFVSDDDILCLAKHYGVEVDV